MILEVSNFVMPAIVFNWGSRSRFGGVYVIKGCSGESPWQLTLDGRFCFVFLSMCSKIQRMLSLYIIDCPICLLMLST